MPQQYAAPQQQYVQQEYVAPQRQYVQQQYVQQPAPQQYYSAAPVQQEYARYEEPMYAPQPRYASLPRR